MPKGFRHGKRYSPIYNIWCLMIRRCSKLTDPRYQYYGGKGVKVCDRWRHSFVNFFTDMGDKPVGKSLDRYPDPEGDYEPSNCRWATPLEQARNKRNNVLVTREGVTKPLKQWCQELGLKYATVHLRVRKGWPAEEALTIPKYGRVKC